MAGKIIPHDSSWGHVTGESIFLDDRPLLKGEVHVDVFGSPVAHGNIKSIDISEALKVEGIEGIYSADDLHDNIWGTIIQDQPILAHDVVSFVGEPILVIAAQSREAIAEARQKIKIDIEELPAILSIAEARKQQAFIAVERTIARGDMDKAFADSEHIIEGQYFNKGQDHFYLESHAAVVYPGERGQLEVHSSSQHPTEVQHMVADALGLKQSEVVCIVKRMGGGFGGKESQAAPYAVYAALAAQKLKRPARIIISKDDDMASTGKRHAFETPYRVGFDADGRVKALEVHLFSDGGAFADLSTSVLERAMLHSDNAYYIENALITGQVCKTHTPPNTAFRGFGGPQGVAVIENIMEEIAIHLGKDSYDIRQLNCYGLGERDITPYGQKLTNNTLPELFESLRAEAQYDERRKAIDAFNGTSKTHLKGMAVTAVKFGISFTTRFLNQGNALVNVHRDGTIQVSTGATEMGQGVNTKIRQIVASAFDIEPDNVLVMATSTERNHNTSPTAASSGTDINGAAAEMACEQIRQRIAACVATHFKTRERGPLDEIELDLKQNTDHIVFEKGRVFDLNHPEDSMSFAEAVDLTYLNRISLSGYAFYKTPGIGFDKEKGQGHPFFYFTNGAALSEVLVDRLTGELKVTRADVYMDLGRRINEGIDMGQVTGAFVQGMGWVTTENLVYDQGKLLSHSPTTYKIPNIQDTPREFNVKLIENDQNLLNVKKSKAVGEPPLLLGLSVWAAVKNALSYEGGMPKINLPATAEEVLMGLAELQKEDLSPMEAPV